MFDLDLDVSSAILRRLSMTGFERSGLQLGSQNVYLRLNVLRGGLSDLGFVAPVHSLWRIQRRHGWVLFGGDDELRRGRRNVASERVERARGGEGAAGSQAPA